jgi:CheY-like chemotaxis protein
LAENPAFIFIENRENMSNILIIDDEKAIRKTLSEILSYEGYKIDEAVTGRRIQEIQEKR